MRHGHGVVVTGERDEYLDRTECDVRVEDQTDHVYAGEDHRQPPDETVQIEHRFGFGFLPRNRLDRATPQNMLTASNAHATIPPERAMYHHVWLVIGDPFRSWPAAALRQGTPRSPRWP